MANYVRLTIKEIEALKTGDIVYIRVKDEYYQSTVTAPMFWNSDADEPDWEVETTNGFVDIYSLYKDEDFSLTKEQALEIITIMERDLISEGADLMHTSVCAIAREAIQKEIPAKRTGNWYGIETECPNCHIIMSTKYCGNCGQRLKETEM